jgi:hypothetical protein
MMIIMLTDIHHVTSVNGNTYRSIQFLPTLTTPPKHLQMLPIGCEDLNAMVTPLSHIHIPSVVTGYAMWTTKLSFATTLLPKGAEEGEVRVQNLNTVIVSVPHIDLVIASIKCNASGTRKLQVSTALSTHSSRIVWCKLQNAMVVTVGY